MRLDTFICRKPRSAPRILARSPIHSPVAPVAIQNGRMSMENVVPIWSHVLWAMCQELSPLHSKHVARRVCAKLHPSWHPRTIIIFTVKMRMDIGLTSLGRHMSRIWMPPNARFMIHSSHHAIIRPLVWTTMSFADTGVFQRANDSIWVAVEVADADTAIHVRRAKRPHSAAGYFSSHARPYFRRIK